MLPILRWWLTLSVLGWLGWPLSAALFRRLGGRGYAYARCTSLLLATYGTWLVGVLGMAPNGPSLVWSVVLVLAVGGAASWVAQRRRLFAYLKAIRRHVLVGEALFAVTFALCALYRSYDPAIRHTEQPMDYALLRSVYRSPALPPRDPWFAGQPVNYYYLGYLSVSVVGRLAGSEAAVAYNLGLAQSYALAVLGLYGVLYDVLPRRASTARPGPGAAAVGALGIALAGNVAAAQAAGPRLIAAARDGLRMAAEPGSWWWWAPSRALSDGMMLGTELEVITEFPAFSLVLGDLHPHVMGLPCFILALGVALALHAEGRSQGGAAARGRALLLAALLVGATGPTNSWDLPTVLVIVGLAYVTGHWAGRGGVGVCLREGALGLAWLGVMSVLFYLPYYLQYEPQIGGPSFLIYTRTPLEQYAGHFGLWVAIIAVDALRGTAAWLRPRRTRPGRLALVIYLWAVYLSVPWILGALGTGWAATLLGMALTLLRGPGLLVVLGGLLSLQTGRLLQHIRGPQRDARVIMATVFALCGLGLTYVTEFVYIRDAFGTRMNTVFKLYYQAWVLLGIAAVLSAVCLWRGSRVGRALVVWWGMCLVAACAYGPLAGYSKTGGFEEREGLDAAAHLAREAPAEYGVIEWLQEHASPHDVLAEAWGEAYAAHHNRVSAWSGVPTVLGWVGHERQWRGDEEEIRRRQATLEVIYTADDPAEVLRALERYSVTYLYVGSRERELYGFGKERVAWYGTFLREVYARQDIALYATW